MEWSWLCRVKDKLILNKWVVQHQRCQKTHVTSNRATAVQPVAILWCALLGGLIGIWIPLAGVAEGWLGVCCWACDDCPDAAGAGALELALALADVAAALELLAGDEAEAGWEVPGAAAWATVQEKMHKMRAIKTQQCRIRRMEEKRMKGWETNGGRNKFKAIFYYYYLMGGQFFDRLVLQTAFYPFF